MSAADERASLLRKDQLERSLFDEKKLIDEGVLKEDNPLDVSESFRILCEACRRGDLKVCQEKIQEGVNINAKDQYDYTPLILASLCGNYETVQLLLESGALCERDTFQGERCLYNALNDRIRNLLLSYDYSKSTDPLQPLAAHLTSLLAREQPKTADITVYGFDESFNLHKFVLAARSPYFKSKLSSAPDTTSWKIPMNLPPQSFGIILRHLYLGELPRDIGGGPGTGFTDSEVLAGVDRISKQLEIPISLSQLILDSSNRRLARQRRQDEVQRGQDQLETWFRINVLGHAVEVDTSKADSIKWDRNNGIFADVLLRADEDEEDEEGQIASQQGQQTTRDRTTVLGIPLGSAPQSRSPSRSRKPKQSKVFPCHKAMLIRSEFFMTMFDSQFKEAQDTPHLQIVSIDCSPQVLEIILTFLYTEKSDFGLEIAVEVLFAADMLFLEKLKAKAAVVISTLGNGTAMSMAAEVARDDDFMDIYEILRAAWLTRVQRLEEFAARYIAYRLEAYIDDPEFAALVKESANRISARQETDSIELLDDIRYYLSERFRLRMEDVNFDEAMDEAQEIADAQAQSLQPLDVNGEHVNKPLEVPVVEMNGLHLSPPDVQNAVMQTGAVRTLDGEIAGDEMAADAINYQILLEKIDKLLDQLKLDA
jgi:ankyrin repeat and BTB/POZ domain-containing protein 1